MKWPDWSIAETDLEISKAEAWGNCFCVLDDGGGDDLLLLLPNGGDFLVVVGEVIEAEDADDDSGRSSRCRFWNAGSPTTTFR